MANIAIFRINYKSDFILTLNSDAGWMTPFCIKFWTGAPSQAYFVGYDGETYTHCAPVDGEPTKLLVQFDDHHLPIGDLKFQIGYHFTVADFPTSVEDEVINQAAVIIDQDGTPMQVMLDLNGETAPEIEFSLPAYANEAQRIANEEQRIAAEAIRIVNEESRIAAETIRQQNEQQRINQEQARVNEFATLKAQSQAATRDANDAATLANQKAQLAQDKADLAQAAATLANQKAQLAADKAALANAAAQLANEKAALAQQKAEYAQQQGGYAKDQGDYAKDQGDYAKAQGDYAKDQGDYAKAKGDYAKDQGDYAKEQGDYAKAKGDICADDHQTAVADHQTATADHQTAAADHQTATADHTQAGNDHTRAESDHTRAESDHAAVEVYVDSLGAFDISAYHATGGVLAKYADLTAALGTNGANIPDALRKGGMSVKFVLSSDNKYVQCRYMSTSTTNASIANVANWQGVDEEVVAGSRNLVTSGGAANSVNQLTSFFEKDIIEGIDVESRINNLFGGTIENPIYYQNFNTKDVKILAIATYQIDINVYIVTASSFGSIPTKTEKIASVKADSVKKVKYLVLNKTLGSNEYLGISGGIMYGGAQGYKMCRAQNGEVTNNYSLGFSIVDIYSISKESFEGLQQEVEGLQQEVEGLQQEVEGLQQEVEGLPQEVETNTDFIDRLTVKGSFGKLPLNSYTSAFTTNKYVNFYKGTAPNNCKITKIKFRKPSSSGTFKAYACSVTFSEGVPTVTALRQVYSKSFQDDSQEFIEDNVNIILAEGEYLGFTGNMAYGTTGDSNYWMVESNKKNVGFEIAVIYNYNDLSKTIYDTQIEAIQEDVQNLQEDISVLKHGYSKYIKLYENNLTQNNGLTVNGTWSFDSNGATPSATGSGTWFRLNKNYWSDKRFMQVEASMKSNTNLIITCTNSSVSDGEGASCFAVDFASGLLKIFSVGAGDNQVTASGYTSTVLESEDISDIVAEHTYRIRLYKDSTLHTLEITDMLTGVTKSVSHNGWAAGRQNQRYGFYVNSGSLPTLKNISIYTLNRPNVVFTGDSITEGVMVTDRTKRYAELYRTNHPHLKVVISAMGGRQLSELISMFDNEWAICKPKILSCLIGANGGNSQNGFESLKAKCDSIGCKLIVHYCTCQQSDDSHIAKNELIGSLPYSGARFDIATAKDNYPLVDSQHLAPRYNSSLYYDSGLHPNIDGDEVMYSRMMLDCIELDIE